MDNEDHACTIRVSNDLYLIDTCRENRRVKTPNFHCQILTI